MKCNVSLITFVLLAICCDVILGGIARKKRQDFFFPDDQRVNSVGNNDVVSTSTARILIPTSQPSTSISSTEQSSGTSTLRPGGDPPTQAFILCMTRCRTTSQYNPVCGNDQNLYYNEQRLLCAQNCGSNVQMAGRGNCEVLFGIDFIREW